MKAEHAAAMAESTLGGSTMELPPMPQVLRWSGTSAMDAAEATEARAAIATGTGSARVAGARGLTVTIIADVAADDASQLAIRKGDVVEIVARQPDGWTYGRKAAAGGTGTTMQEGWFPDWACSAAAAGAAAAADAPDEKGQRTAALDEAARDHGRSSTTEGAPTLR